MRPIRLKISGLNSYIETQTIDFDKLTERGLFGIFGPTGCGKSTILDAIILSLYGHKGQKGIPRSTNEFINTAVDQASINYLFGLDTDDGPRKVFVERKFKRTNTGLSTSFSRLQLMTEDEDVLEVWDKTTDVSNQVVELLGLTREDFMRSVVLPQGKFSEFLTLEGKERRDMLERLLNLKAYGSALQMKIKRRGDFVKEKMLQMEGEMKRYSDLTPETIEEVKTSLAVAEQAESELLKSFELIDKEKADGERLYKVIEALANYKEQHQVMKDKLEAVNKDRKAVERAKSAEQVWPYYNQFHELGIMMKDMEGELADIEETFGQSENVYKESKKDFDAFSTSFDSKKELLTVKKASIEKVRDHKLSADKLKKERETLIREYKTLQADSKEQQGKMVQLEKALKDNEAEIKVLNAECETNTVPVEERERILDGVRKEENHRKQVNLIKQLSVDIQILERKKSELSEKIEAYRHKIEALKKEQDLTKQKADTHQENLQKIPERKSDLDIEKNEKTYELNGAKDKLKEKETLTSKREDTLKQRKALDEMSKAIEVKLLKIQDDLNKAEAERLSYWTETVLSKLSEEMGDNSACPLCGSLDHPHIHIKSEAHLTDAWAELEEAFRAVKLEFDANGAEISRLDTILNEQDQELENYKNIDDKLIKKITDEINDIGKSLEALNLERIQTEKEYKLAQETQQNLTNELDKATSESQVLKTDLVKVDASLETKREQSETALKEAEEIKLALNMEGEEYVFPELYEALKAKDEKLNLAKKKLKEASDQIDSQRNMLEELKKAYHEAELLMEKTVEKGSGLKDRIEAHEKEVHAVVGDLSIDALYNQVVTDLTELINKHQGLKEQVEKAEKTYQKLVTQRETLKGKIAHLKLQYKEAEETFTSKLEMASFESVDALKASYMDEKQLNKALETLKKFDEDFSILTDRISELERERAGRELTSEGWAELQESHKLAKDSLEKEREKRTTLAERLKTLERESAMFEKTLTRYKKYEQAQDLVSDLLDLVRGNKFVEYVALTHLQYIAMDASKRLMDITNHRYSLELDAKGNFIICDHYNGGVKRDTKTLSGGETFLTALSLSLALSSQIQLKGRTNLEFFFLDEGFGTLDNELLDIVMTSLEKLFHEKLTVGIISHVDELKNRVPIKLTVEPAQAGVHGTKTKIEVT